MPFNGSGTFNRLYSWVTDAANGLFVSSTRMDADTDGIATALSNCMTRDGQSPATANIPLGGFKLTGIANGTSAQDAVAVNQVKAGYTDASFLGSPTTYSAPSTYTAAGLSSEVDALGEITLGAGGTFIPSITGTYQFFGTLYVQTSAGTAGISGNAVFGGLFLNGVQSVSLMSVSWPFANSLSRFITFPAYVTLALAAADIVTFRSLAVYTGTAPSFQYNMGIRRLI